MHFVLFYEYVPDYLERRGARREAHLQKISTCTARGELVLGGAFADPADEAMIIFSGGSVFVAEDFARADPYLLEGLVTRWWVREWITVVEKEAAAPVPLPTVDLYTLISCMFWKHLHLGFCSLKSFEAEGSFDTDQTSAKHAVMTSLQTYWASWHLKLTFQSRSCSELDTSFLTPTVNSEIGEAINDTQANNSGSISWFCARDGRRRVRELEPGNPNHNDCILPDQP